MCDNDLRENAETGRSDAYTKQPRACQQCKTKTTKLYERSCTMWVGQAYTRAGAFHPELCNACPIEWLCHHCYNNPTRKPKPCDHSDPHAFITCRRCPNRRTAQDQAALKPFYPNGYNWTCDRCRLDPVDSDDETDIDSDQSQQE
jgi:hypothetical protein